MYKKASGFRLSVSFVRYLTNKQTNNNNMALICDNNINENRFNQSKLSKSRLHKLKQLLKPVFAVLRQKKSTKCTYIKSSTDDCELEACCNHCTYYCSELQAENYKNECTEEADSAYESDQNEANEQLEQRIMAEINALAISESPHIGVPVYFNRDQMEIVPVVNGQKYIPVHFAKTDAGTFFWTSVQQHTDDDLCSNNSWSEGQLAEQQVPCDRWAQA